MKPTATMAGNNMLVAVRLRPLSNKEKQKGEKSCCQVIDNKIVAITKAPRVGAVLKSEMGSVNEYQFDEAFDDTISQEEVYKRTAKRIIPSVLEGFNVTVFAYGATGSGKTHTMMGSERIDNERATGAEGSNSICGIIPLTLIDIFTGLKEKQQEATLPNEQWKLSVSFLEVYNEKIRDLLEPNGINLPVQEDPKAGLVGVGRLSTKEADNADSVMSLLRYGNGNRKTHATDANNVSSRSHAVLQIILKQTWNNSKGKNVLRESRVNLIDLAGSERAGKTNNRGERLQEGANINRSLLALANCINALAQGSTRKNAKYRDSKLTHLLKSSLEGQCKLIIIANVNPSDDMFEDSHNTLKYANRAKCMKIDPKVVRLREQSVAWPEREKNMLKQKKEAKDCENDSLKKQVEALQSMLGGKCPILPDNGLDVLTNLKNQVKDDQGGGRGKPRKPKQALSPTNSCPGTRRSYAKRRQSENDNVSVSFSNNGVGGGGGRRRSSSASGSKSSHSSVSNNLRRRRASVASVNMNMGAISEDKSVSSVCSKFDNEGVLGSSNNSDISEIVMEEEDIRVSDNDNDNDNDNEFFAPRSKKSRPSPMKEKLPRIHRSESNSLMDMSDISEISAHESVLASGFDDNAPVEDRVGALESRVMDMAQSRRVMLDFITDLQKQKSEAEGEVKEQRRKAIEDRRDLLEQKALVLKLQAHLADVQGEGGGGGGGGGGGRAAVAATPSTGLNNMCLDTPQPPAAGEALLEQIEIEIDDPDEMEAEVVPRGAMSQSTPTKRKRTDGEERPFTGRRIVQVAGRKSLGVGIGVEGVEEDKENSNNSSSNKSGAKKTTIYSSLKAMGRARDIL